MTPLRQRTLDYMSVKGYAESTKRTYIQRIKFFALHFNRCPSLLDESHVFAYLSYVAQEQKLSKSTINATYSALKILYVNVLGREWNSVLLPRVRRERKLPQILSTQQVQQLFEVTQNIKHRTILMLIYCAGLRLEEVTRIKVEDIVANRKRIFVRKHPSNRIFSFSRVGYIFAKKMSRAYRNIEEMRQMYDRFQSSQQTISSFCEREGINKHTFQYWRRKILVERSRSKATEPLVGFRQIFPEETQNKNVLRLHLSPSVDLELPFDYPTANLIQLLRGVSC